MKTNTALLAVYYKDGIVEFARALVARGWDILASKNTAKAIAAGGVPVRDIGEIVGDPILGHRVVTLSREVHAGLLARNLAEDEQELARLGLPRIDLVCVDLYPLRAAIAAQDSTRESVIETTDVGGPTLLHSGAKGERIVISDPADRERVIEWLDAGRPDEQAFIDRLDAKADAVVADYCLTSSRYRSGGRFDGIVGERAWQLCYGENKRQGSAALMKTGNSNDPLALDQLTRVEGKDPSYVNATDLHRLIETATRLGAGWETNFGNVPLMGIAVKHGNACGAAVGNDPHEIIRKMVAGDPDAISGGLVLVNFEVDAEAARLLRSHLMSGDEKRVLDSVLAPGFTDEAVHELSRKTGKCRLFVNPAFGGNGLGKASIDASKRFRQVRGGFLVQDGDPFVLALKDEWRDILTPQQQRDLVLGWGIGTTSNSNTIILTKDDMLQGGGTGQRSRVMAARVALLYAETYRHDTRGAVAYSDSFFPFKDGPLVLAGEGISVIFATSGSIRDKEVAEICEANRVILLRLPDEEARGFYGH